MLIKVDTTGIKQTKAHEYLVRFVFGGAVTAAAAIIGDHWGPAIAGLFLAFPAIFPASVTLLETHERKRKERKGLNGTRRAAGTAADYAMGTALGSFGLLAFAAVCWRLFKVLPVAIPLTIGTLLWAMTVTVVWFAVKRRHSR